MANEKQRRFREFYPDVHPQVCEFFPDYDYRTCVGDRKIICRMDSGAGNKVGHQQRAFSCWWALETCGPLDLGLDLGSPRGMTPYAMHVDVFGDGRVHPYYGGGPYRADIVRDASNVADLFPADTFPLINSNHSLEHMHVDGDAGIGRVLDGWVRLLRPGGVLAMIVPDNAWFDVLKSDRDHAFAWSHEDFRPRVLDPLMRRGAVDLVEYDTLDNHFSFNVVLRRK